jgi:hypothetical protein
MDVILLDDGVASSTGSQPSIAKIKPSDYLNYIDEYIKIDLSSSDIIDFKNSNPGITLYRDLYGVRLTE